MPDNLSKHSLRSRARLASAGVALSILLLTLAVAWTETRWPSAAWLYITVTPTRLVYASSTLWQLRHVDGVRSAAAVFQGSLESDEIEDTPWTQVWFYASQTDDADLAFLPPDPTLKLHQGRLPDRQSLKETALGYELAQALH